MNTVLKAVAITTVSAITLLILGILYQNSITWAERTITEQDRFDKLSSSYSTLIRGGYNLDRLTPIGRSYVKVGKYDGVAMYAYNRCKVAYSSDINSSDCPEYLDWIDEIAKSHTGYADWKAIIEDKTYYDIKRNPVARYFAEFVLQFKLH
jgi:hypothetical protein